MPANPEDARAQRRGDHDVERRRAAQQRRAAKDKEARERAERLDRYRKQHRRRNIAFTLFGLAIVVAVSHILEHADAFALMSPGWQDPLLGYPTAALLAIIGGMLLPAHRS